jgi:transcriptional antiterminator NusG
MTKEDVEKNVEEQQAEGAAAEQSDERPEERDTAESTDEQAVAAPEEQPEPEIEAEAEETPPEPAPEERPEIAAESEEEQAEPAEAGEAEPPAAPLDEKSLKGKWYVVHAHSGHENKVKQSIENRVRQEQMQDIVSQVLVPTEEVAEVKGGKKRITSRKIFPGYVMVQMELTHKTWHMVRTTPGVTGFIGSGKMPTPLEPEEIELIFKQMRGEQKKPKPKVEFEKDERVKIIEGPFANFMGSVDEVNSERGKLKVMVEIFERLTSVELEFWQVEKT